MNPEQYERLQTGVENWNQWRREHPREQIDLRGADLTGADLREAKGILAIGPIGSRGAMLYAVDWGDHVRCYTGCFPQSGDGRLDEFAAAVDKTHGDNRYGQEYRAAIEMIRAWYRLQRV